MEGITSGASASGVSVTIDRDKLAHVNTLLQAFPDKALTIYERAIRRGVSSGRRKAEDEIRQRYDIPLSSLRQDHSYYTFHENVHRDAGGVVGQINFGGTAIPLYRFHPDPKTRRYTTRYVNGVSGWRITTEVSAADVKGNMIRHNTAFIATFKSGHTGIFSRFDRTGRELGETGAGRAKIRELFGFNVRDMLAYEPARQAIEERMREIVEKRIDHELMQTLERMN